MKIFKRIYYPVMAALVVLMLVLGLVDARVGGGGSLSDAQVNAAYGYARAVQGAHNSYNAAAQQSVRDVLIETLTDKGAIRMDADTLDEDGKNLAAYAMREGKPQPTVSLQKATVSQESQTSDGDVAVAREVHNVILSVPGTGSDAILLYARYDGSALGGASDATATGALLQSAVQTLENVKNGASYKNTVVFLFGDAGQEGDLGAYAFMQQFAGFDTVAEKVRAAADFAVGGTGGTLMMYAGRNGSLGVIGAYARFNGGTFASSALSLLFKSGEKAAGGAFGDASTLRFTNRGDVNRYATANDVKVNKKLVRQQANAMQKFVSCFADTSVADLNTKSSAVYFSYLDVMTVYYPAAVAFVIAGIIAGLIIAIVILNIRNKTFGWGKALAGAAVQLVTLLATSLSLLALYYLFALLLSGFGVLPFQGLSSVRFDSIGLLISAAILAVTLSIFFYILLKRTFAVKAADVVRGNTLLVALVAFVLSFAAPGISYPFTCVALFSLTAMLMTVLFKHKFKNKFGMDIERLFLYVWPVVIALPLFLPLMAASQAAFPVLSLVLVMAVAVLLTGCIAPFADYLKPVLDKVMKKLPPRKVRYERMVTERVEDRAKKGKFTEVTAKKIVVEKTPWTYLNRIGLSLAAFISAVMIVLFCSFSTTYSSSALAAPAYYDSLYDDSMLFVYEKNGSDAAAATVEVHDKIAYNYIRYAVNDLNWNADKGAYVKEYTGAISQIVPVQPDFTNSGKTVSFTAFDSDYSQITVTLKNASKVTSVIFNENDESRKSEEYTFTNRDEIVFRLPYGYEDFTMTVDADCEITFEQQVYNANNLQGVQGSDWDRLYEYYGGNNEIEPMLRSGIVIRITKSITV